LALKPSSFCNVGVYDPIIGEKISETDAMDGVKRFSYNLRGQVDCIWGSASDPVRYEYDDIGRMVEMHTYRTSDAFTGGTFPEGMAAMADPKTKAYEVANRLGITTTKLYAYVNGDGLVKEPGQRLLDGSIDK